MFICGPEKETGKINTHNLRMKMKTNLILLFPFCLALLSSCKDPTISCFTHSPDTITTSTVVTFNAACSEEASYFTWNFGDATADTTTTALNITHQYSNAGTYTVRLQAERKDGQFPRKNRIESSSVITVQ